MEDVLTTYALPYDADYPPVCLDEKRVTWHAAVVEPLPVQVGQPERIDYEYERVGTAHLLVMVERLAGYRHVEVTERRTAQDYARQLQWLADVRYPNAQKIRLVQENLNTHRLANLYLVFPPHEAQPLAERFELPFTPTHGSWLDMAEFEIGILERGCLGKRVAAIDELTQRVAALEAERNAAHAPLNWRFTADDAPIKLARRYPKLEALNIL